ncbi:probable receptor-like protein kinase At5g24010 [Manihot esculenta]|uniref:probable receptor-like protein kinase At5g24010 n=1 Tax=Manihot esculenta TaxID=3983 RepID=UPI001CC6DBB5|nr:probable receptor-like protein kinase At5g24010 [Manihot esculenta]
MAKFIYHLLLIKFLYLLLLSSSAYTSATNYSINCGSESTVSLLDGRTFVGDKNSDSFSAGNGVSISSASVLLPAGTSPLYQTARIYRQPSYYELTIADNGTYLLRFHFLAFSSEGTNLSDALFSVSASKFLLLSNFSVKNTTHLPVIKEFFLTINADKFRIYFKPDTETSFAFVNALEVLILPQDIIKDEYAVAVPPLGTVNGTFLLSNAFQTLYRIDVGQDARISNDPFWRDWVGDDPYLIPGSSAKNCTFYYGKLNQAPGAVEDIAPDLVYRTCKEVSMDIGGASNFSNITWSFNVRKKAKLLVRLHFCDTFSVSPGTLKFDLYIYTKFKWVIDPSNVTAGTLAAPIFRDCVLESDDSGYVNFSIGPNVDSEKKDAFLHGLEIMEFLMTNTSMDSDHLLFGHPSNRLNLVIGLSVGGVGLISILIILFLFGLRRRRAKPVKALFLKDVVPPGRGRPHSWITSATVNSSPVPNLNLKLKMPFSDIIAATRDFDNELLIGEGGFGKVYKGTLPNGIKVAVKRSDSSHGQGLPEFQTEVTVLSKICHRHLVSLIGYCYEGSEMTLVYEFMEKGTLRDHLYTWKNNSKASSVLPKLTWKQRLEICIGAAKGLHYLHTGSDGGIIHRDVKSTNILLDEHYVAKVADFGLSQAGPPDPDHFRTGLIGSFGYLDPEYVRTLELTDKSDVYSFGVVLLEVLCARPPIVNSSRREEINLAEWAMLWQKKGQLEKIMDPSLAGEINPNSLRKFGEIAEKCLEVEGAKRPTMLDVCWDLEYALQLQQSAVPREPYEDSTTDVSSAFVMSYNSFSNEEGCLQIGDDDESDTKAMFS